MPGPRSVLLMTRSLGLGGSERQLTEIAKSLDRGAFQPHVACFHAEGFRAEELRAAGVPLVRLPVKSFFGPSVLTGAAALGRYLREHNIELVHTFDVPMNLFGVPAARLFRVPRVLSSQRAHRALTPGFRHHLLRITDHLADAIVVNSEAVRRDLIEADRVPAQRIHLCYNGLDTSQFQPPPGRPATPVVIGVICALRPEKGLETLLEAFAQTSGAGLRIVGDGHSFPTLQTLALKLKLGDRCEFEPGTKHVAERLGSIHIFVLPSLSEAFSNSLMEAMACECCVVASRVGGNPELITDGETGLLFPARDSAALARSLQQLIDEPALRTRLAAAGAARIRRDFTLARAARRMAEIYESISAQR